MRQSAHGTPYPAGSRVVHIGLPKTGTSSIQAALHRSRDELARHDVVYAGQRRHSRRAAKAAIGQHQPWLGRGGAREWAAIASEVRSSDARCVFLSSEALSEADAGTVSKLVDELGGRDGRLGRLQILVTLRPLADVLSSSWQQGLRNGYTTSLPRFCEEVLSDPPTSTRGRLWRRRYEIGHYLRTWGELVGEDALTFVIPDPADRGMLMRAVEELLALPAGALSQVPSMNLSLPYPEAEVLRYFALAFERAGGDEATWMDSLGRRQTKTRLTELARHADPYPITVPRWAAERADEVTAPCLEALRASDAHVVGDLGHLLVDPARYEETGEPPRTVRVDSAGELAHVLHLGGVQRGRLERRTPAPVPTPDLDAVPSRELLRTLASRARAAGSARVSERRARGPRGG